MAFTPHAKLPFKLGLGNFDYNGNTSLVLRIHYATSNKIFGKWLPGFHTFFKLSFLCIFSPLS